MDLRIPPDVADVLARLHDAGHEAYVVGGCVRDAIRGVEPEDWDIATHAKPERIQEVFKRSLYTNRFGTVVVRSPEREIEVTTYRIEADYSDARRPDRVEFTDSLLADLARRDFTMNAMAWSGGKLVDPHGGRADLERKMLRAVGDPGERFREDALRMLRAVRFATVLGMEIEPATAAAIRENAPLAATLSGERVNQELTKMLLADRPSTGFRLMSELGLLAVVCPELEDCRHVPQDKAVAQDVFEHSLLSLDAVERPDLVLRLAALLHDVGKPETMADGHFHQHEFVGEHLARRILRRWKFPKDTVSLVAHLIRHHMFWYQDVWTGSAVRRFIRNVGLDNIPALFELRRADNIGSGARAPRMYALDQLWLRVQEEIQRANAFSARDLAIDGNDIMAELDLRPGPEVGRIVRELLERVLDDPELNTRESLLRLAKEIHSAQPADPE
ncbi:MAG TPA: HD domain-containing protein [Candidatus Limnocylindria bacterium]|nr:HD domain-containing protein [Candidatus Limnocylindria bacterium]